MIAMGEYRIFDQRRMKLVLCRIIVEHRTGELGQLVQEQDPAMGAADLAGTHPRCPAADERDSSIARRKFSSR